jgi:peptidoglycan/LPS O-acetylase OafA/YrhL
MKEYRLTKGSSVTLDLIRGVSAQVVVIGHGISFFGIFTYLQPPKIPAMQNIAVLIFFLLSGFLITYSTIKNKKNQQGYSFKAFFIDRFSRIYTTFIPALFFVLLVDIISKAIDPNNYHYNEAFNLRTFAGNLFMLQDYPPFLVMGSEFMTSFGSARPFWSLAIEWWIYLFVGYLLINFTVKDKLSFKSILILIFFSVVPLYNFVGGRGNGLTVTWIFGALIFLIIQSGMLEKLSMKVKVFLLLSLIALALVRLGITIKEYEPVFAFALAMALLLIIDITTNINFNQKLISAIQYNASFSFTLYLIHYSILDFIAVHFKGTHNPYMLFMAGFVLSNIFSIIIGRYTEMGLTRSFKTYLYSIGDKKKSNHPSKSYQKI